jgi:hypothetical protein
MEFVVSFASIDIHATLGIASWASISSLVDDCTNLHNLTCQKLILVCELKCSKE